VIIGGFGPKMAELAGRLGDGINTPAGPLLERLVDIARAAHESSGRDPAAFVATTSGPFTETWADPGSRERQRLARAGVDRVILHVGPPYDHARIAAVGRHLR
jgi:alkanesulfonate monooxygenase SsuD/methylene tetrahydromethanopterin reductase-like flavin-dependent oxidoreductase (luciferase family)